MTQKKSTEKEYGHGANSCRRCGRRHGLIRKYGLYLCRQCFREMAKDMGFEKYS
ncbi:MAG: 30S ribosomal protein S14 [Halobacteriota archaeon]|nr:30S ribosomal protein S14 [Halobacteriota archaeon]